LEQSRKLDAIGACLPACDALLSRNLLPEKVKQDLVDAGMLGHEEYSSGRHQT
jgi:hypothetical protein